MTTARHTEPLSLTPVPVTDWQVAGPRASYTLAGTPGEVDLEDGFHFLRRFTAAIHQAALEAKRNPVPEDEAEWITTTPVWALFAQMETADLYRCLLAAAHLHTAADQLGELAAMYLADAAQQQVVWQQTEEVTDV